MVGQLLRQPEEKCCEVSSPSVLDNLKRQQTALSTKLERVNEAIKALEENPQVSRVLELLAKANY